MCWDCVDRKTDPHKDFIRGGVGVEDFEDEIPYRHPKRRAKKARARSQTRTPCPGAEDGKHVYTWVPSLSDYRPEDKVFLKHFGYAKREVLLCCGCSASKGYGRESEAYLKVKERKWRKLTGGEFGVKRGEPVSRGRGRWGGRFYSFSWEDYDQPYQEVLAKWLSSADARALANLAEIRRIEFRLKLLGYTD